MFVSIDRHSPVVTTQIKISARMAKSGEEKFLVNQASTLRRHMESTHAVRASATHTRWFEFTDSPPGDISKMGQESQIQVKAV